MIYEPGTFTTVPNTDHFHLIPKSQGVFICICKHADGDGRCWPSYKRIREFTGIKSDSTVKARIDELVEAGFITYEQGKYKRRANYYQIHILQNLESSSTKSVESTSTENGVQLNNITKTNNYIPEKPKGASKQVSTINTILKPLSPNAYQSWFRIPTQRNAAKELHAVWQRNPELFEWMVKNIKQHNQEEFFPSVYSPYDLQNKFEKVKAYFSRNNIRFTKPIQESTDLENAAEELGYDLGG